MEDWRSELLNSERNITKLNEVAKALIADCTPNGQFDDMKLVLQWKFVPFTYRYFWNISELMLGIKPFIDSSLNAPNQIQQFVSILT